MTKWRTNDSDKKKDTKKKTTKKKNKKKNMYPNAQTLALRNARTALRYFPRAQHNDTLSLGR